MTILVTAGPTREPIDPVRYITNRSSGRMGHALCASAARLGHRVILISGPTALDVPPGIDYLPAETAEDMFQAVKQWLPIANIAIFAAAVSDYRPKTQAPHKIKKNEDTLILELVKTPDILAAARTSLSYKGLLVGFAAETEHLEQNARRKLQSKGCDLIVANDVSRNDIGFDSPCNEVLLVYPDHTEALPIAPKDELADTLLKKICAITKK